MHTYFCQKDYKYSYLKKKKKFENDQPNMRLFAKLFFTKSTTYFGIQLFQIDFKCSNGDACDLC